jgi:transposase
MLRMDQVHVLRHKVFAGRASIRRVARELGLSRNTVSKYLTEVAPVRRRSRPRAQPVWERVQPRVEELLAEWEPRTTAKQRLTGVRLHRALREEGYQVGLTAIHEYLRERQRQRTEVYVPLIHRAGDEAQVDFFEVTVELGGTWVKAWKFLLRLMYSGREFVWLYRRCDRLAFFDGHVRAFRLSGWDSAPLRVRQSLGGSAQDRGRGASVESALRGVGQPLSIRTVLRPGGRGSRQGWRGESRHGDSPAASGAGPARRSPRGYRRPGIPSPAAPLRKVEKLPRLPAIRQ